MQEEVLNISPIVVWVVALSQLLTFGLTIWGLMSSGSRANAKRIEDHGKRIDDHGLRINGLEQGQRAMPSKDDMHELELAMEQLKGEMKTMSAVMTGNQQIMERLEIVVARQESHLLEGGKR
jgi:hypothetical protein